MLRALQVYLIQHFNTTFLFQIEDDIRVKGKKRQENIIDVKMDIQSLSIFSRKKKGKKKFYNHFFIVNNTCHKVVKNYLYIYM